MSEPEPFQQYKKGDKIVVQLSGTEFDGFHYALATFTKDWLPRSGQEAEYVIDHSTITKDQVSLCPQKP